MSPILPVCVLTEAAASNSAILAHYGYNLSSSITVQADTTMSYGSEFHPVQKLNTLLRKILNYLHFMRLSHMESNTQWDHHLGDT